MQIDTNFNNAINLAPFEELEKAVSAFDARGGDQLNSDITNLFKKCIDTLLTQMEGPTANDERLAICSLVRSKIIFEKKMAQNQNKWSQFPNLIQQFGNFDVWQKKQLSWMVQKAKNSRIYDSKSEELHTFLSFFSNDFIAENPFLKKMRFGFSKLIERDFFQNSCPREKLKTMSQFAATIDPLYPQLSPIPSLLQTDPVRLGEVRKLFVGFVEEKEVKEYLATQPNNSGLLHCENGSKSLIASVKTSESTLNYYCEDVDDLIPLLEENHVQFLASEHIEKDLEKRIPNFLVRKQALELCCKQVKESGLSKNEDFLSLVRNVAGLPLGLLSRTPPFSTAYLLIVESIWNSCVCLECSFLDIISLIEKGQIFQTPLAGYREQINLLHKQLDAIKGITLPLPLNEYLKSEQLRYNTIEAAENDYALQIMSIVLDECEKARNTIFIDCLGTPKEQINSLFEQFNKPFCSIISSMGKMLEPTHVPKSFSDKIASLQYFHDVLQKIESVMAFGKLLQNRQVAEKILRELPDKKWLLFFAENNEWQYLKKAENGVIFAEQIFLGENINAFSAIFSKFAAFVEENYLTAKKIEKVANPALPAK